MFIISSKIIIKITMCDFKGTCFAIVPLGCFKDDIPRAIDPLEGNINASSILIGHYKTRPTQIRRCYLAAKYLNYRVFAVQDGGQCFSSATAEETYAKYGKSTECLGGEGGPMASYVYRIKEGWL